MKRITTTLISLLVFSTLTAGFATAATITVRADSWAPYNEEPNSAQPGYMIELAKLIFEAKGHEVDYQLMPWSRSLDAVGKGTYDAVVGTDPEESPDFVFPAEPLGVNKNGFYVKKGSSWKYEGIDSIKQIRLGIIDGYGYYSDLDSYIEESKKSGKLFAATGEDALPKLIKMLKAGRLDAVIENINVMTHELNEEKLSGAIVQAGSPNSEAPLYMAFSPAKESSKEYAKILDAGIVELRSSGKLQKILAKYGLKDWK
jgi:polar amino acid transport system substrate-binding protein